MYGIQKANHLIDRLVGLELTQVGVGFHDIIFNFSPSNRISVFSPSFFKENFEFLEKIFVDDPKISPFGKKITHCVIESDVLKIRFENDSIIFIRDDSANYESVRFQVDGLDEVV